MAKRKKAQKKALHKTEVKASSKASARSSTQAPVLPSWGDFFSAHRWPAVALLGFAMMLYAMTWEFGYILDDKIVITENQFVQKGFSGIWDILTTESMTGYFGEQRNLITGGRYRPLSLVTFAVEQGLFGQRPSVSHALNSLLLGWTAVLLFYLATLLWPGLRHRPWYAQVGLWAGLFFIVHPVHTEVVANIKGRDEMLALILALHATVTCLTARRWLHYIVAGLLFYLGLLAKENAMTFLAVIPLLIHYFGGDRLDANRQRILRSVVVLGGVLVLYLLQRYAVIGYLLSSGQTITELMNQPFVEMTFHEKYATIARTLLEYVRLLVWPHPLSHDYYPYAISIMNWGDGTVIASVLLHLALVFYALRSLWTKSAYGAFIWMYLATLSIVSNVPFTVGTLMNERFIYMPSIAFVLALSYALWYREREASMKWVSLAASAVLIAIASVLTIQRLPVWGDNLRLNASAVAAQPGSARAQMFYGTALYNEALLQPARSPERTATLDKAMSHILKSIDIYPGYANGHKMRSGVAAKIYEDGGDIQALLSHFMEIVRAAPKTAFMYEYLDHLNSRGQHVEALKRFYLSAGYDELILKQSDAPMGLTMLTKGLALLPGDPDLRRAVSDVYQRAGRPEEAAKYQ